MDTMWLLEMIMIFRPLLENIHRVIDALSILERTSGAHNQGAELCVFFHFI